MLYIVGTPIGNLKDISERAIDVLRSVDVVACEDTRHTGKLLKHLGIDSLLVSYHEHNEKKRSKELIGLMLDGKKVALVSDAGMPGISDPGYELINRVRDKGLKLEMVPGPVAFASAVVLSGLPTDRIYFGGFLPSKASARKKELERCGDIPATLVFYESPHRLTHTLRDAVEMLGNRKAAVIRELTKLHEDAQIGTLEELAAHFEDTGVKGEIVVVIDRNPPKEVTPEMNVSELVNSMMNEGVTQKDAIKRAAKEKGLGKSEAYRIYQQYKDSTDS